MSIEMFYETVVYKYKLYVARWCDVYKFGGVKYVPLSGNNESVVAPVEDVISAAKLLSFCEHAQITFCRNCNGNGAIYFKDKPSYKCSYCNGRGYFIGIDNNDYTYGENP